MTPLCRLSVGHLYYSYVLTIEVFITSWWVVNQSIVTIILFYASTGFKLDYPTLGGVKPLIYILLSILYPTLGGVTPLQYCCFIAFL